MSSPRKRLKDLKIHPKRKLGQHFVVDPNVLRRIIETADLEAADIVVEIGAGLGGLTAPLAQRVKKVYAIELDPWLAGALQDQFSGNEHVEVILEDALRVNFVPLFQKWRRRMKVVANLPYEISSPMLFRLFRERECFCLFVLMLQMEVARKIVAKPGTKDYGPLSLWTRLYARARIAFPVSPRAFHPRPKVDSAVVRFGILPKPCLEVEDEKTLHRLIRSAFAYRRKMLPNALQFGEFSHLPLEEIQQAMQAARIDLASRGEALSLEQFRDLSRALSALNKQI